ncbi:Fibronectin, type III domain protein [Geotalea uraniireducens Rf4]|uniref:Fibronectin, type III domain protein n=2 Tax=Geotalea uraniireducens TaxID=351604 RepID=A5GDS1_GEOUR|nr:Fibronectin, type III domain protein [Geotalea uraniireducens Rf4]
MTDSQGSWVGIEVGGVVADNIKVKRYELYYGIGDNPSEWYPAMTGNGSQAKPIAGIIPVNGRIGMWNVSNLNATRLTLRLKVVDEAGNVSCDIKTFSVDTMGALTLSTERNLFSPNTDGIADEVTAAFHLDKNATIQAQVFGFINGTVLETSPVRSVVSGRQHLAGTGSVVWNGMNDAGSAVRDGRYGIAITAVDACGNTTMKWSAVEVDNTPPLVAISYPSLSLPLPPGNIIEVKGTVTDLHLKSFLVEAGAGDMPAAWTPITTSTTQVNGGVLAVWSTVGLEGRWTLRVSAEDAIGNQTVITAPIDLGIRSSLVKSLNAVPPLFSPNNDQKLDVTRIDYEVADTCQIKLEVVDGTGQVVRSQLFAGIAAGVHSYSWDGKNNNGVILNDGQYTLRLTATLATDPLVSQSESITVTLDNAAPVITIAEPADKAFLNRTDVAIIGSINDPNLLDYSLSLSGSASASVDKGNTNRANYSFDVIKDLAEGTYTILGEVKDRAENQTSVQRSFSIDRTPPKVTLEAPKGGEYFGNSRNVVNITGTITEANLQRYSMRYGVGEVPTVWQEIMGGDSLPTSPLTAAWKVGPADGIADGTYTVSLYAIDKAGLEAEVKARIFIDNTPPTVTISSLKDGDYVKGALDIKGSVTDANLDTGTLEISEGLCSVAYKWVSLKTFSDPVNNGLLQSWKAVPSDGIYCLKLSASDKSGNKNETKISFKIDTHPPTSPHLSGRVENKTDNVLTWTRNTEPDLAGYNIYLNGSKPNTTVLSDNQYTASGLAEGEYAYTVKAVDFAGNESEPSNIVKLRIDLTGPSVRISSPQEGAKVGGLVDVKGTAYSSDDFKEYRVYVGQGAAPLQWTLLRKSPVPVSYGNLAEWDASGILGSIYAVKLEAEDVSGNIATLTSTFTIDQTAPAPPRLISADPAGSDVILSWEASPDLDVAGYLLFRNGQIANLPGGTTDLKPYLLSTSPYTDKALPDGKYSYYLVALDYAGNMSLPSEIRTATIDVRRPKATIVAPENGAKIDSAVAVKAECPDRDVVSVQFRYKKSTDTAWLDLGGPVVRTPYVTNFDPLTLGLLYGDYQIAAAASDATGVDPAPAFIMISYTDLTPPAQPQNLRALTDGANVNLTWDPAAEPNVTSNIYRLSSFGWEKINASQVTGVVYQDAGLADGTYSYRITAVDAYGNESIPSEEVAASIYAPVILQPFTPTTLRALTLEGNNAGADARVEILTEGASAPVAVATADVNGKFVVSDFPLVAGENRITARAVTAGGTSRPSEAVIVIQDDAPSAPTGLTGVVDGYNVHLGWNQNLEPDLAGYRIYHDGINLVPSTILTPGEVTASSSYVVNPPEYVFDSDPRTVWVSDYAFNVFPEVWFQVGMASATLINKVEVTWFDANTTGKDFVIQAWTGYAWVDLARVSGNADKTNSVEFRPYRTDKIRLLITATNGTGRIKQVAISDLKIFSENLVTSTIYDDLNLPDKMYEYKVSAIDTNGFESPLSDPFSAAVGDVTPPEAPVLIATTTGSLVSLGWVGPETDVAGYVIYRKSTEGWTRLNAELINGTTFSEMLGNGVYTYKVTAVDAASNESAASNEATATVSIAAPPAPINVAIVADSSGGRLTVSWDNPGGSAVSFNIYRGMTTGGAYTKANNAPITSFSFTDIGLNNGQTYFYVVTAIDAMWNLIGPHLQPMEKRTYSVTCLE